jgi:hypothetical protein
MFLDVARLDPIGRVERSNFDGSQAETLASDEAGLLVQSLAIDPARGDSYYVARDIDIENQPRSIRRAKQDASVADVPLDAAPDYISGLTLDPAAETLYFGGQGEVWSADLSGSNSALFVLRIRSVALDRLRRVILRRHLPSVSMLKTSDARKPNNLRVR